MDWPTKARVNEPGVGNPSPSTHSPPETVASPRRSGLPSQRSNIHRSRAQPVDNFRVRQAHLWKNGARGPTSPTAGRVRRHDRAAAGARQCRPNSLCRADVALIPADVARISTDLARILADLARISADLCGSLRISADLCGMPRSASRHRLPLRDSPPPDPCSDSLRAEDMPRATPGRPARRAFAALPRTAENAQPPKTLESQNPRRKPSRKINKPPKRAKDRHTRICRIPHGAAPVTWRSD
jgi:hypothetical protein